MDRQVGLSNTPPSACCWSVPFSLVRGMRVSHLFPLLALDVAHRSLPHSNGGELLRMPHEIRVFPKWMSLEDARKARLTLNMSRALGHIVLRSGGIRSSGEYSRVQLPTAGSLVSPQFALVVATDGVWDVRFTCSLLRVDRITIT